MRPLTILLLATAVTGCFVASLAPDGHVAIAARLVYGIAFVAAIIAFTRGLPRTPEAPEPATSSSLPRTPVSVHG